MSAPGRGYRYVVNCWPSKSQESVSFKSYYFFWKNYDVSVFWCVPLLFDGNLWSFLCTVYNSYTVRTHYLGLRPSVDVYKRRLIATRHLTPIYCAFSGRWKFVFFNPSIIVMIMYIVMRLYFMYLSGDWPPRYATAAAIAYC